MKIVVALDKFKHSLDAPAACAAVAAGLRAARPDAELILKPLADGGDGAARAMIAARGGEWIPARVRDPLGREINSGYGWFAADQTAVVEMAAASGLALLDPGELDPLRATSAGTGQLLRAATVRGARRIWLGVGGSATVDGGVGAARELGWQFLDAAGQPIGPGGGALASLATLVAPARPIWPPLEVLCDVDNPLCGPQGAAAVFGPQKGATPAMVAQLDAGLERLARVVSEQLGVAIRDLPGAGAAGGLPAGAVALLNARLAPGIETLIALTGLDDALRGADWVITGEGRFDEQSLRGKVVSGVVRHARRQGVKVAVLAGQAALREAPGVDIVIEVTPPGLPLAEAFPRAPELLAAAAARLAHAAGFQAAT